LLEGAGHGGALPVDELLCNRPVGRAEFQHGLAGRSRGDCRGRQVRASGGDLREDLVDVFQRVDVEVDAKKIREPAGELELGADRPFEADVVGRRRIARDHPEHAVPLHLLQDRQVRAAGAHQQAECDGGEYSQAGIPCGLFGQVCLSSSKAASAAEMLNLRAAASGIAAARSPSPGARGHANMSKRLVLGLVLAMLAGVFARAFAAPPLEDMVRLPEFTGVSLSPDGRHLAVATPVEDRTCLVVLNIEDLPALSAVLQSCPPGGESVFASGLRWANDERILFRTTMQVGNLAPPVFTGRIFAVNIDGKNGRQIHGPVLGAVNYVYTGVDIVDMLPDDPEHILVSTVTYAVQFERLKPRVERVNVYNGYAQFVVDSPLARGGVLTDRQSRVRFATGTSVDDEQSFAWRPDEESDWIEFRSPFDSDIEPLSFTADGTGILVASRQEGELGVWRVDLETGERRRVLANERSEVRANIFNADRTELIGARFEPDYPVYEFIDPEHPDAVLWQRVMAAFPGHQVFISGFTRDRSRAVVSVSSDRQPPTWYLLDTEDMQLRFLLAAQDWIDPAQLSAREPFRIRARDGLELTGYLTLPPDGRDANLPAVMLVHGGPHGPHDTWAYDLEAQLLASRGYAVVQLNFRGSGGYGQQFERAGYGKWGTAMQDDVTDATRWLISEGIADPERICIYGASYGGYAVLAGITREPDLYACAFSYVGVYDLDLMFRYGDIPQSPEGKSYLKRALGDRRADADDIAARSPVNHVAKIKTPLFVAHGRKDQRVPIAQYKALTRALDRAGIPYEKLVLRNEGHSLADPDNRIKYYTALLNFLERHTGGAAGR